MERQQIIDFFNRCASGWDSGNIFSPERMECILNSAGVTEGSRILDVACGTGVMIPFYLERSPAYVVGVDISPEMIKIAKGKFRQENVRLICGDITEAVPGGGYDCAVVYNAFPHFPNPELLVSRLAGALLPGGRLTIAHGTGREHINRCHSGGARHISQALMPAETLARLISSYVEVVDVVDLPDAYQVTAVKK